MRIRGWNSFQKQIHAIEIDDGVANVQHVHAEESGDSRVAFYRTIRLWNAKHKTPKDRATGWQKIYPVALLIALGMLTLYFLMIADLGMPGLQGRVFIFLFLLWLSIVVHNFFRLTA